MATKLPAVLFHLPPELLAKLDELSAERGIPRSALIRRAVEQMLRRYRKVPPKGTPRP